MRSPLTLALAQPFCTAFDVAANAIVHAAEVRAAQSRVVVFPELSLTGYELDALAITPDDSRLEPLIEACSQTGALALAGAPVRGGGDQVYLAMLAIDGDGAAVAYCKQWLGGIEALRFTPGPEPVVWEVDGWRLGLAICRDTGIPQHAADTAALGMDVYVASVLEHAADAHITDQRARRIATEHQVWVAVSSFAGSTGGGYEEAAGRSGIWTPAGEVHSQATATPGTLLRATLT